VNVDQEQILQFVMRHKGKLTGAALGLIVAWLTLRYGFWRALLACAFVVVGFALGALVDREGWERVYDLLVRRRR